MHDDNRWMIKILHNKTRIDESLVNLKIAKITVFTSSCTKIGFKTGKIEIK